MNDRTVSAYVDSIKVQLEKKVKQFQAGCLSGRLNEWKRLTSDHEVLNTVRGMPIEFEIVPPLQLETPNDAAHTFNKEQKKFMAGKIKELERCQIIQRCSHEPGEFISPIFLTPKSDGSYRLILNLKKLNEFTPYQLSLIHI